MTQISPDAPIIVGKIYLYRFQFPGLVWLKKDWRSRLIPCIESFLPCKVIESKLTYSKILSDLNWLNVPVKATGLLPPDSLIRNVAGGQMGWGAVILDCVKEVVESPLVGAARLASIWEMEEEQDIDKIIQRGLTWGEVLKPLAIGGGAIFLASFLRRLRD